jgi:hypothetical protein
MNSVLASCCTSAGLSTIVTVKSVRSEKVPYKNSYIPSNLGIRILIFDSFISSGI